MIEPVPGAGLALLRPNWPTPASVHAAFTTRAGGCSAGEWASLNLADHCGDDPQAVAANRAAVAMTLDLPSAPVWLEQVHGRDVLRLPCAAPAVADASWTDRAGVVCAVLVADCLPVLFCDCAGGSVGVAHAGWRGLSAGVLEATVAAMPVPPQHLLAWLGPAIGPQAFEVGSEVREVFVAAQPSAATAFTPAARSDTWLADLYALARQRLAAVGVSRVCGGGLCTATDAARFYSYRRDRRTGRMAGLIWLAGA